MKEVSVLLREEMMVILAFAVACVTALSTAMIIGAAVRAASKPENFGIFEIV